jgi:hypothetical protein
MIIKPSPGTAHPIIGSNRGFNILSTRLNSQTISHIEMYTGNKVASPAKNKERIRFTDITPIGYY